MKIIQNYSPYNFQSKTIQQAIEATLKYNGCCIFDETGLGKTITGSHIAVNVTPENGSILIVSPKANQKAWVNILPFATICTKQKITLGQFDTIIVDEAHHFNNLSNKSYQSLVQNIYFSGKLPKVIMLTATPLNNNLREFGNMLRLIPFKLDSLPFYTVGLTIPSAINKEKELNEFERFNVDNNGMGKGFKAINDHADLKGVFKAHLELLGAALKPFCFRNTRLDITENYKEDIELMGHFPKVHKVNVEVVSMFEKTGETIKLLDKISFAIYNVLNYSSDPNNVNKNTFNGIMKTLLMKRLDSSVSAFKSTLDGVINSYKNIIDSGVVLDGENKEITVNPDFWSDCKNDLEYLETIKAYWLNSNDNQKLNQLLDQLNSIKNKTVIFTEYVETQKVIFDFLKDKFKVLEYNGSTDDKVLDIIANEFDRNLDKNTNNYQILIATDALAEGVNLHLAESLIHYDLRWNPSRLIQREGRINRLVKNGVKPNDITVYSFGVNNLIESIVKLERKLVTKTFMSDLILNSPYEIKTTKQDVPQGYTIKVGNNFYGAYGSGTSKEQLQVVNALLLTGRNSYGIKTSDGFLFWSGSNFVQNDFQIAVSGENKKSIFTFPRTAKAKDFNYERISNYDAYFGLDSKEQLQVVNAILSNPLYYSLLIHNTTDKIKRSKLRETLLSWGEKPALCLSFGQLYGESFSDTFTVNF